MKRFVLWCTHHFIPHEGNNHAPHFLRGKTTLIVLGVVVLIELLFLSGAFMIIPKANFFAALLENVIVDLTNENRVSASAPRLSYSPFLERAAQLKAHDMATRGYFSHTDPNGREPWYWLGEVGYAYSYAGENLAVNFVDSSDVVEAWMNSPSHRDNLLSQNFTEIGIGVARGTYQEKDAFFVVQFFGRPFVRAGSVVPASPEVTPPQEPEPQVAATTPRSPVPQEGEVGGEQVVGGISYQGFLDTAGSSVREAASSPRRATEYVFGALGALAAVALLLTIFVNIDVQHPRLIIHGTIMLLVIVSMVALNYIVVFSRGVVL